MAFYGSLGEVNFDNLDVSITDTAVDVFVYDTSKDSDGGAWRKRTQHTSWYNETLGTATRGSRKEFPAVAVIVATAASTRRRLIIYDGDDPNLPMWMIVDSTDGQWHQTETASPVYALNGIIALGSSSDGQPIYATRNRLDLFNFISDKIEGSTSATEYEGVIEGIVNRSDVAVNNKMDGSNPYSLVNYRVNDVAMTVLPNAPIDSATGLPIPTIAVATNGGTSIIKDDGTVADLTGFNPVHTIHIDSNSVIGSVNTGGNDYLYKTPIPAGDAVYSTAITAGSNNYYMDNITGTTPTLRYRNVSDTAYNSKDDTLYRGGNNGFDVIKAGQAVSNNVSNSIISYITSDYNTGWMHGDIKGAFLSDTDTTNVTSSNLISGATYNNSDRITSYSYTNGSSTLVITDNPATADGYVTLTLGGLTPLTTYVLTVTANQTYTPTTGYNLHIGNTADSTVYFEDNFTGTASQNITFKTASSGSPSLVLYSNYNGALTYTLDLRLAEFDRSVGSFSAWNAGQTATIGQKRGLAVFGTVTKTPVATGAELVAYSGNGSSNYLSQPYNSDLDFGTNSEFSIMGWINTPNVGGGQLLMDRSVTYNSSRDFQVWIAADLKYLTMYIAGGQTVVTPNGSFPNNTWFQYCVVRKSNRAIIYINGIEIVNSASTVSTIPASNVPMKLLFNNNSNTKQALFCISGSAPSPEQIKKIYEDEKVLFQENAKCTLYGSSDAVTALAYDEDTDLLHVGTSAGRSEFQGLRRINNTTDAVTTAISASNGLVAEQ